MKIPRGLEYKTMSIGAVTFQKIYDLRRRFKNLYSYQAIIDAGFKMLEESKDTELLLQNAEKEYLIRRCENRIKILRSHK